MWRAGNKLSNKCDRATEYNSLKISAHIVFRNINSIYIQLAVPATSPVDLDVEFDYKKKGYNTLTLKDRSAS